VAGRALIFRGACGGVVASWIAGLESRLPGFAVPVTRRDRLRESKNAIVRFRFRCFLLARTRVARLSESSIGWLLLGPTRESGYVRPTRQVLPPHLNALLSRLPTRVEHSRRIRIQKTNRCCKTELLGEILRTNHAFIHARRLFKSCFAGGDVESRVP